MGLDRLSLLGVALLAVALLGCDSTERPRRLVHGEAAAEFRPVPKSAVAIGRVLRGTTLGRRFALCRSGVRLRSVAPDAVVVERIGVFGESLTFFDRRRRVVYACDGGVDIAGERRPPWCSGSVGRLFEGRLLDARLDLGCRAANGDQLAYAWVEPVGGAHWIGVDQGSFREIYEVLSGMPVRVATNRHVHLDRSSAEFELTQYDVHGRELLSTTMEAAVAG
jgi:hypothetical protein